MSEKKVSGFLSCTVCGHVLIIRQDRHERPWWNCNGCVSRTFATSQTVQRLHSTGGIWEEAPTPEAVADWRARHHEALAPPKKVEPEKTDTIVT